MSDTLTYKAKNRYSLGWTDPRGVFGSAPIKGEGQAVSYDSGEVGLYGFETEVEFDKEMDDGTTEVTTAEPTACEDVRRSEG